MRLVRNVALPHVDLPPDGGSHGVYGRSAHPATRVSCTPLPPLLSPVASAFRRKISQNEYRNENCVSRMNPDCPEICPNELLPVVVAMPAVVTRLSRLTTSTLICAKRVAAEPDVLRDRQVDVLLRRRAHVGDGPRRVAEGAGRRGRERRRVEPRRRCVIGRGQPIAKSPGVARSTPSTTFGRCAPPNVPVLSLCCRPIGNPLCSVTIAAAVQPPAIEVRRVRSR